MATIKDFKELDVYQMAFKAAIEIHNLTKSFPLDEKYSLIDQIRRSSRSVCANIGEAWRKRKYPKSFISKLTDCEGETSETQIWLDFSHEFKYIDKITHDRLYKEYDLITGKLITMRLNAKQWCTNIN